MLSYWVFSYDYSYFLLVIFLPHGRKQSDMSMSTCPLRTCFLLVEEMVKFRYDFFTKLSVFVISVFILMILM